MKHERHSKADLKAVAAAVVANAQKPSRRRTSGAARTWLKIERLAALDRQDGRCAYCRTDIDCTNSTADHVKPLAKGGRDIRSNIVAACEPCNLAKAVETKNEFLKRIKRPAPEDNFYVWRAWMRRRLSLATERAERNILRSVGLRPSLERKGRG